MHISVRSLPGALGVLALFFAAPARAQGTTGAAAQQQGASVPAASEEAAAHLAAFPLARALPLTGTVVLDGRFDEAAWLAAEAASDFTQNEPDDGQPATQRTEVRFLFDDDALYIAARMFDSLGAEGVVTRLVRRDANFDSDYFQVTFDTYHDHLGRATLRVNPAGVKYDALAPGNSCCGDPGWDPIWDVATSVDSLGWTAELRIPLSQLRFGRGDRQTWGMQLQRFVQRRNEFTSWSYVPRTEAGGPARYGHLDGLRVAKSPRRLEVLPYTAARSRHIRPGDSGNPFNDGSVQDMRYGADLKYLLTSNLQLDVAINPDFGQVEVDPAVVNLSAFETSFPEKRPFFLEGAGIFSFGGFSCFTCSNVQGIGPYYTRRIGRAPQAAALAYADDAVHVDMPENSTILGAAKITGRTGNGWTLGVMEAVTRREDATIVRADGSRYDRTVEPMTNYLVARAKKDLLDGNLILGGLLTSTSRSLGDDALRARLNSHAELLGADFQYTWAKKTYSLVGAFALTNIAGEADAILRAQRSSARYFQRPDRGHGCGFFGGCLDAEATSMQGLGTYTRLSKDAGNWIWEATLASRTPGYEPNDLGIMGRSDYVFGLVNARRMWTVPTQWYRRFEVGLGAQRQYNWDGDFNEGQVHGSIWTETPQFWYLSVYGHVRPRVIDERLFWGGPAGIRPANRYISLNVNTDSRKPVVFGANYWVNRTEEDAKSHGTYVSATVRPTSWAQLRLAPSLNMEESRALYVTDVADPTATAFAGRRYVFGSLDQQTVSMETRLNITASPTLSLELFAQPFIAGVNYYDFKEFVAPRSLPKQVYGRDVGTIEQTGTQYTIDPDGAAGSAAPFTIGDPDFNTRSLRGNAVLRWEYRPGSTLFLVWTQSRANRAAVGDFDFDRDRSAMFAARPDNVFLVKMTYWLGR